MEQCTICNKKFKDIDKLLNHIADEHGAENNKIIEITPELCTELGVTESQINVIKNTVAMGATDAELMYFLQAAKGMGLNPINKEIYFMKLGGKVTLVTGRDGYLKIAQRNPLFRGLYSAAVYEKDEFKLTTTTGENGSIVQNVEHSFSSFTTRGKLVGAWARCEMEGQAPVVITATFAEYGKNTTTWQQYPQAMMQKVPESMALKRVCGISGMVTAAEIADEKTTPILQAMEITADDMVRLQQEKERSSSETHEMENEYTTFEAEFESIDEQTNTPSIESGRTDKT